MNLVFNILFYLGLESAYFIQCQVIEFDNSYSLSENEQAWLVNFFAPWCGHCKRLEPIFHQVYLELKGSPIKVIKVDATIYTEEASKYNVMGYPSIRFIQGEKVYNYNGERENKEIIKFAKRANGPPVINVASPGRLKEILDQSKDAFFYFAYDGETINDNNPYYIAYLAISMKFTIKSNFYSGSKNILPQEMKNNYTIMVFKDDMSIGFTEFSNESLESDLENFVNEERFTLFPVVGGIALNEISNLQKLLVIFVVDESTMPASNFKQLKEIGYKTAKNLKLQPQRKFQFLWMVDVETATSLFLQSISPPEIFVYDSSSHTYYLSDLKFPFTQEYLESYLEQVLSGKYPAYGGRGFIQQIKRFFFEIFNTMIILYKESFLMFCLVFGVPMTLISLISYVLCCMSNSGYDYDASIQDDLQEDISDSDEEYEQKSK